MGLHIHRLYRLIRPTWDRAAKYAEFRTAPESCSPEHRCEQAQLASPPMRACCLCPAPVLSCATRGDSKETHADKCPPESAAVPAREAPSWWAMHQLSTSELWASRQLVPVPQHLPGVTSCSRQVVSLLRLSKPRKDLRFIQKHRRKPKYFLRPAQLEKDYLVFRNTVMQVSFFFKINNPQILPHSASIHTFRSS